jgi:hypothetical protein
MPCTTDAERLQRCSCRRHSDLKSDTDAHQACQYCKHCARATCQRLLCGAKALQVPKSLRRGGSRQAGYWAYPTLLPLPCTCCYCCLWCDGCSWQCRRWMGWHRERSGRRCLHQEGILKYVLSRCGRGKRQVPHTLPIAGMPDPRRKGGINQVLYSPTYA